MPYPKAVAIIVICIHLKHIHSLFNTSVCNTCFYINLSMLGWREKCSDRYVLVRVDEFKNSMLKTLFYFLSRTHSSPEHNSLHSIEVTRFGIKKEIRAR
jgi:hypothetical protein